MVKKAKIYTYTIIHTAAESFKDKTPYVVGILNNGKEQFAAFIDGYKEGDQVKIGMDVEYSKNDDKGNPVYKLR